MAGACSRGEGKTLRPPPSGATAPLRTTAPPATSAFSLRAEFDTTRPLDREHTCEGRGEAPRFTWSAVPAGSVEVAFTVVGPGDRVFWVVTGIPAAPGSLGGGNLPREANESLNSQGEVGWHPPCPGDLQDGEVLTATAWALTEHPGVRPDTPASQAMARIRAVPGWSSSVTFIVGR